MQGSSFHGGNVVVKDSNKKVKEGNPAEVKLWLRKEYGIHWSLSGK